MNYIETAVIKSIKIVRDVLRGLNPEVKHSGILRFFVCNELQHVLIDKFKLMDFELEHTVSLIHEEARTFARQNYPDAFNQMAWNTYGLPGMATPGMQENKTELTIWLKEQRLKLLDHLEQALLDHLKQAFKPE